MKKSQKSILIAVGLLIISCSSIVSHYIKMPDFIAGSLIGFGIGVMIVAFIRPRLS